MVLHIFCKRRSSGADDLVRWVNANGGSVVARRLRNTPPVEPGLVVCWGESYPAGWPTAGYRFLNKGRIGNKMRELSRLKDAGVTVPAFGWEPKDGWLARRFQHHEASDLLQGDARGDYYVEYVPNDREYRVHVMGGLSVRAGVKVPRTEIPNARFRAWVAGWKVVYGEACRQASPGGIPPAVREAAKAAVRAMGYDFGAVDVIVRRSDGVPVVLEVNSAPGLEGRTVEVYGEKLVEIAGGGN